MSDGPWTAADVPDCSGRVVAVTGANSGVGLEATRLLAGAGAHVVMACRSRERAEAAREDVLAGEPAGSAEVMDLDLASLDSVRSFADAFAVAYDGLDVLVNNAGVMAVPRRETEDGFELQFGVNHLGHFALTGLLLDELRGADGESRVVTVSSGAHESGEIDFEDLQGEASYGRWDAYGQSKLANLLFAFELQRRLAAADEDVLSVGVHPGYAATNLQARAAEGGSVVERLLMPVANRLFAQSAERGALPTAYAATHPDVEGGEYVGPGGFMNVRGYPEIQAAAEQAYDEATAERLWTVSEELTGVEYDL